MRLFLAEWIGDGSEANYYRPRVDAESWTPIDLRPDSSVLEGRALVATSDDAETSGDVLTLGDDWDARTRGPSLRAIESRLGLTLTETTMRGIIAELLILHGTAPHDRTRWNRLQANRFGRHQIFMLGESIYDAPAVQGVTITDDFNRANSGNLGANWSTAASLDPHSIVSNEARNGGVSTCRDFHVTDLDTENHYVQALKVSAPSSSEGLMARRNPSTTIETFYYFRHNGSNYGMFKCVTGTFTALGSSVTEAFNAPATMRIECDGSSVEGFRNGVSKIGPFTDSAITGNLRAGFNSTAIDQTWDDFEAGDLAAGTAASLFATADGTITDVVDEADATVDLFASIDDDPASPSDADWINNTDDAGLVFFDLTDLLAGFATMDTAEIVVRFRGQNFGTGTVTLFAQLFQSNETTTLSNEVQVAQVTATGAFANTTAVSFTGLNTTADKTVWDAARVRFRWAST